jgi:cytochrome bd ubiquinol oxidase subunit I
LYVAYRAYLRGGEEEDLRLTKAWMRGTAILFATGAVSGTALSFQLGLLWPTFMEHAGPIFGMPFSLEGAAFFLEAIFLGLFLYGWGRVPQRLHLLFALLIGVFGLASGVLVIAANGWMNAPAGFTWADGRAHDIDVWAAMFNRAWPLQSLHMLVAAFQATTLGAMGLHALGLLQKPDAGIHRRAIRYLAPFFVVSSLVQPVVGDLSAKSVANRQPEKLAAMEAHFHTQARAPLLIGGIPDPAAETVSFAIWVPGGLSFLAHGDLDAEVTGLDAFPREEWPPVVVTHLAFQVMVGLGMLMVGVAVVMMLSRWRGWELLARRGWLWMLVVLAPAGFVAIEAGWVVTEVGRQPWIIYRIMKTADAVTPVTGLGWSFLCIVVLYLTLGAISFYFLWKWMRLETARA